MKYKAILFDLDGTLLPMDLDTFKRQYFSLLVKSISSHGYEPTVLMNAILKGVGAMLGNSGLRTNEQVFFDVMESILGKGVYKDIKYFEEFYENEFDLVRASVGYDAEAGRVVKRLKEMGYRLILATNPVFPDVATKKRIEWAGLSPNDFEYITTYENSKFSKPNVGYYKEILDKTGLSAAECLMVGNDTADDMSAGALGIDTFLVTDYLINEKNIGISIYKNGKLSDIFDVLT